MHCHANWIQVSLAKSGRANHQHGPQAWPGLTTLNPGWIQPGTRSESKKKEKKEKKGKKLQLLVRQNKHLYSTHFIRQNKLPLSTQVNNYTLRYELFCNLKFNLHIAKILKEEIRLDMLETLSVPPSSQWGACKLVIDYILTLVDFRLARERNTPLQLTIIIYVLQLSTTMLLTFQAWRQDTTDLAHSQEWASVLQQGREKEHEGYTYLVRDSWTAWIQRTGQPRRGQQQILNKLIRRPCWPRQINLM